MATRKREGLPEFWTTGIAKLLVGDTACKYEAWIKGHYRIDKLDRSGDFTQWKVDHTAQLNAVEKRLIAEGWKCKVEQFFRLAGQTAILTGKADLVTTKDGARPTIRDVKTGKPRDSDVAQVCIYMVVLPLAWKSPGMVFNGEVIYADHTVLVTPTEAQAVKPRLFALLRELATGQKPAANPSENQCKFCDVTLTDCPDRWTEKDSTSVLTSEF